MNDMDCAVGYAFSIIKSKRNKNRNIKRIRSSLDVVRHDDMVLCITSDGVNDEGKTIPCDYVHNVIELLVKQIY